MSLQTLVKDLEGFEQRLTQKRDLLRNNEEEISTMMTALEVLGTKLINVRLNTSDIDVSVCGDKLALNAVWGIFRKLGYIADSNPNENEPTFTTWFEPEDDNQVKFWLSFSSTVCKRVKVGTETVERDLYAVQCDDDYL